MLTIAVYFATKNALRGLGVVLTLALTLGKPWVILESQLLQRMGEGVGSRKLKIKN